MEGFKQLVVFFLASAKGDAPTEVFLKFFGVTTAAPLRLPHLPLTWLCRPCPQRVVPKGSAAGASLHQYASLPHPRHC